MIIVAMVFSPIATNNNHSHRTEQWHVVVEEEYLILFWSWNLVGYWQPMEESYKCFIEFDVLHNYCIVYIMNEVCVLYVCVVVSCR